MTVWILLILFLALLGAAGFFQGAIRAAMTTVGLIVAAMAAKPLGGMLQQWFNLGNEVWNWLLPPLIVFVVIWGVFIGLSFLVHKEVEKQMQHRTDDIERLRFERLNQRSGVFVGALNGIILLVLLGIALYPIGHLTAQVSTDGDDPLMAKFASAFRKDMGETGLDKLVAGTEPASEDYFTAANILGLIYHNPLLHNRLANYPPYLTLADQSEISALATDTTLMNQVQSKENIGTILESERVQDILKSKSAREQLLNVDLQDLHAYLKTGKSPKYHETKILGNWDLDPELMLAHVRINNPNMRPAELIALKKLVDTMKGVSMVATVDNRVLFSYEPPPQQAPQVSPQQAAINERQAYERAMIEEFGGVAPPPAAQPEASPDSQDPVQRVSRLFSGTVGSWEKLGNSYRISVTDSNGKEHVALATADDEILEMEIMDHVVVFIRSE